MVVTMVKTLVTVFHHLFCWFTAAPSRVFHTKSPTLWPLDALGVFIADVEKSFIKHENHRGNRMRLIRFSGEHTKGYEWCFDHLINQEILGGVPGYPIFRQTRIVNTILTRVPCWQRSIDRVQTVFITIRVSRYSSWLDHPILQVDTLPI